MDLEIRDRLKVNRPTLSDSTLKTYGAFVRNIFKVLEPGATEVNDFFDTRFMPVIEYVKEKYENAATRKTIYAALSSYATAENAKNNYREFMMADAKVVNEHYMSQEKSEAEVRNWIDWPSILATMEELKLKINSDICDHEQVPMTNKELQSVQKYVIISLYTLLEPRRLLDYTACKIKDFNPEVDNFLDRNDDVWKFRFNQYKTCKTYGLQVVDVPPRLKAILMRWIKLLRNRTDYLLINVYGHPLTASTLGKKLNSIFGGRNIAVNMIRHSYLTHTLGTMPKLQELQDRASNMGHSVMQELKYIKK